MRKAGIDARLLAVLVCVILSGCHHAAEPKAKARETYAKDCNVPPAGWHREPNVIREEVEHYAITLEVNGATSWTGTPVDMPTLRRYMHAADARPGAEVRFLAADDADCGQVRAIRALMNEVPMCSARNDCIEGRDGMPPPPPDADTNAS